MISNLKIHSQQGGFCVVMDQPCVGKSVLKEHTEQLNKQKDTVGVSFSRTKPI